MESSKHHVDITNNDNMTEMARTAARTVGMTMTTQHLGQWK